MPESSCWSSTSPSELRRLHHDDGLTRAEIAERFGVEFSVVALAMSRNGIDVDDEADGDEFDPHPVFAEKIRDAVDVCNNCFLLLSRERENRQSRDPRSATRHAEKGARCRHERNTVVDYGPATQASEAVGTFCECGVESAFHRVWEEEAYCLGRDRVVELASNAQDTLVEKGVPIDGETFGEAALEAYLNGDGGLDEALSAGIERSLDRSGSSDECTGAASST